MLTLEPPYYEIDGVLVYRDHAVPTQFYYTAPPPQVSRMNGRLMFDLMTYAVNLEHSPLSGTAIPQELGAGFLTMGVDCSLSETRKRQVARGIADQTGIAEDTIILYPIPYTSGEVRVLALDQFSVPGEPPGEPDSEDRLRGRPTFVERIVGSARPSLLGDLRTIFSLKLSQDGVTFLEGLYERGAAPVGIVYELEFYGMRPAVEARVVADLSRIYQHFGGGLEARYAWFKADVSAGIDFLEEVGAIEIDITSQAVGEDAQKSKELALDLFKEKIVQELFRPIPPVNPASAASSGSSGGADAARAASSAVSAAAGAAASAASGVPEVALSLRYKRAEELKRVEYDFRERAPERRVHSPQGFLSIMISESELKRRIHRIDLRNDFFDLLEVLVSGPTPEEFAALHIRQIEARLTYGDPSDPVPPETRSLLFRPDATGDRTFAVRRRGRRSMAYTCQLTYEFSREERTDSDAFRYELPPKTFTGRTLRINPYEDFGVLDVEVEPGRIHQDIREVDVHLTYQAPDSPFVAEERFRLVPGESRTDRSPMRWHVRTRGTDTDHYTVKSIFHFHDGSRFEAEPYTSNDPLLRIDAPFSHERRLLIQPNVIADQIRLITVELDYHDEANGYRRRFLVSFEPPFDNQQVVWPILNPDLQTVRYRVMVHEPGFISEGDWQETADPSLVVGGPASRIQSVQVNLIGGTFHETGIDAVLLQIEQTAPDADYDESHSLLIEDTSNRPSVNLVLPPGARLQYRYKTTTFKSDGTVVESEWIEANSPLLVISTRTL